MILSVLMLVLSVLPSVSTDEWNKTFNVEGSPKLRIVTSDANIRVTTMEGGGVSARIKTQGWRIGGDGLEIIDRQNGDQIDIEVRYPHHVFQLDWGRKRVDIEVKVPRSADLDLHTG